MGLDGEGGPAGGDEVEEECGVVETGRRFNIILLVVVSVNSFSESVGLPCELVSPPPPKSVVLPPEFGIFGIVVVVGMVDVVVACGLVPR